MAAAGRATNHRRDKMEIQGNGGSVSFDGQNVVIRFKGLTKSTIGIEENIVPLASIAEVTYKAPSFLSNGYICVRAVMPDGTLSDAVPSTMAAANHPYCMVVPKKTRREFEQLVDDICDALPAAPVPTPVDMRTMTKSAKQEERLQASEQRLRELRQEEADRKAASAIDTELMPPNFTNRGRSIAKFKADDGTKFEIYQNAVESGHEIHWLKDVHATVEDGSAVQDRITATRIMLVGFFALAWKKKRGGEKWLTISGPDFIWLAEVGRKQIPEAMRFANAVNNAALKANLK